MNHEVTSFDDEVLARSREVPVLVDFWADWCGPCLMFAPVLEKAAAEADGAWELVKVNTESHPELSARYRVRSLPTLKLFVGGEAIAESLGALSEPALKSWLARHLPSPFAAELEGALTDLAEGRTREALAATETILAAEPANDRARILRAKALLALDPGQVAETLRELPASSEFASQTSPLRELAKIVLAPANPTGGELDLTYAAGIAALRELDFASACEAFLPVVERDREHGRAAAAAALKQIFFLLGPRDAVTETYQRQFASLMFS